MAKRKTEQSTTQAVTGGSAIRFEQPRSSRQHHPIVVVSPDIHPVSGFLDFLREHAVVSLAIAFVIGLQSQTLVKQLVTSFIDPLFKLLFGQALSQRTFTLHWHDRAANFGWGAFVYGLLDFLFVLAAVYAIVKILKLDKLDKPNAKADHLRPKHKKQLDDVTDVN
jgi:large-conductance mechanosensitive channel